VRSTRGERAGRLLPPPINPLHPPTGLPFSRPGAAIPTCCFVSPPLNCLFTYDLLLAGSIETRTPIEELVWITWGKFIRDLCCSPLDDSLDCLKNSRRLFPCINFFYFACFCLIGPFFFQKRAHALISLLLSNQITQSDSGPI